MSLAVDIHMTTRIIFGPVLALLFVFGRLAHGAETQKRAAQFSLSDLAAPLPVRQTNQAVPWAGEPGPVSDLQVFAREKNGAIWLGGIQGAARFDERARERWSRWQYFHGRRWLADNAVQNIWVDPSAPHSKIWIRTQTGASLIEWVPLSLAEKADIFNERIEKRHIRHGFVSGTFLSSPGGTNSSQTYSNDNDGLWTAMYLAAESYRHAVTKSRTARDHADRAARALLRLEEITGIPGFPARSFISRNELLPGEGEWHDTPDGKWKWKGDTSSDELVGHYYGYALYYDLAAGPSEKAEVRQVIARMTDYLMAHDYDLLDVDQKPTRWGQWSERYFQTEEGKYEAPLRSLELLAFLKTAFHITANPKYQAAYLDRISRGYADRLRQYRRWDGGGGEINFSDDELAYLSYHPLLQYEKDPVRRQPYLDSLRFTWAQVRSDRNPLWNYISGASGAGRLTAEVREESLLTLRRIPLDLVEWTVDNGHRQDIKLRPGKDRFGKQEMMEVLAPDERPVQKWNANPYRLAGGGGGQGEDDGTFFLLPYWMGRYHGWVR